MVQGSHSSHSPFFPTEATVDRKSTKTIQHQKSQTVASVLIELLASVGVKKIFGVAGDALNGLTDALSKDGRIEWIGFRHEENAAFAACAAAEISGGLAVCAGTVGPGALHLINGLYNAKKEGAAVLAITGQVPLHEHGTNYFQEVNLTKVFDDVCGFQAEITSPTQMLRLAELAIQYSLGERAVSRLEIPIDVMTMKIENLHFLHPLINQRPHILPAPERLDEAARMIRGAKRPALFCGAGCRGALDEVIALSEKIKAPIAYTLRAKDIFESTHENVASLTGLIGLPPGYHAVLDCDLLIMLGTNFPYETFLPVDVPIIQLDKNVDNIGRRAPVSLGLIGTVKETLQNLLPKISLHQDRKFLDSVRSLRVKSDHHILGQSSFKDLPVAPHRIARMIGDIASDDSIFSIDVGESTVWAARYLKVRGRQRLIGSFNHGSMGCGLPLALGASSLNPEREVWALCGDGAFVMSMADLVTAVRFKWPVKIVVFNNSELGFVKMENEVSGNPLNEAATGLVNPQFAELAKSCGVLGIRIERPDQIEAALSRAKNTKGPVLIEAMVSPGELTLPPHIDIKQAFGFGVSKLKEGLLGLEGDHEQWENWKEEFRASKHWLS